MSMRIGSIICFVLAALTLFVATNNVFLGGGSKPPETGENTGYTIGYAVGSFLWPVLLLALGLSLRRKARNRSSHSDSSSS